MTLVPIFTYGTLRKGEGNYSHFQGCVDHVDENATARGHLWFAHPHSYPVAIFSKSPDRIHGDVLWCYSDHPLYHQMCDMEVRAGYEMVSIPVEVNDRKIEAFGFHYTRRPNPSLFIPSGDWRKEIQELYA
jgi:gamma-glutamylcyclotransferase (GGCT)/AIG2-like uncharacterized protein YtfP